MGPGLVRYFAARQISRRLPILGAILAPTTGAPPPARGQALVQFPKHCKITVPALSRLALVIARSQPIMQGNASLWPEVS